jgi:hypothetical protein
MSTQSTGWGHEQVDSVHPDELTADSGPEAFQSRPQSDAPSTGDPSIDSVLDDLATAQTASLAERIAAGERATAALQSRLNDLGGA